MTPLVVRLLRIPVTIGLIWAVLAAAAPLAMAQYRPFFLARGSFL